MQTTPELHESRIHIDPGFQWDAQDAYLFDIDGTLLRDLDAIHMSTFVPSIQHVTGVEVSLEGVPVQGSTDTAILREACRRAGIAANILEPQIEAILEAMRLSLTEQRGKLRLLLMPGVEAALAHLARCGALLGVATGNLETIGWIKIEEAGLREWFRFGGFSDRFPIRSELVANAARKAREMSSPDASVCVIGDTPRDIEAAHANSLPVIAVATGRYSFDTLVEFKPQACASSLADLLAHTEVAS